MNLAVRLYSDNPDKPEGIPADYPWQCVQEDMPEYADKVAEGWIVMSLEDFDAYKAERADAYAAYAASLQPLVVDVESMETKALKAQVAALLEALGVKNA